MKYLKSTNKQDLLNWIDTVYAAETIAQGIPIPQPGCSYGQPRECKADGDTEEQFSAWALEVVPSAEKYTTAEPWASMLVEDPVFPTPPNPFPL